MHVVIKAERVGEVFLCCIAGDSSCNYNIVMEGFTVICSVLKLNNVSGVIYR